VILSVYEQPVMLDLALAALAAQDFPGSFEVIVCDDGSSPRMLDVCRRAADRLDLDLRFVWQPDREYRLARSRNNAIRCAQGDLLVFLDGDIVVKPDFLRLHSEAHEQPRRIVCGPRRWVEVEADDPAGVGLGAGEIEPMLGQFEKTSRDVDRQFLRKWFESSHPWLACAGYGFSVRRSECVHFDEEFVGWGVEDREFVCRLVHRHGHSVSFREDIDVFHLEPLHEGPEPFDPVRPTAHHDIVRYLKNNVYFWSLYPDLDLSPAVKGVLRYRLRREADTWERIPPGEIPWEFGASLSQGMRERIEAALRDAEAWLQAHDAPTVQTQSTEPADEARAAPSVEFDPSKKSVLFFTRGRGRGHAIPDIEIVKELLNRSDEMDVRFVSYATGARTIEEFGFPLIDLGLPELNPLTETTVMAGKLIGWLNPDLVVAHEEFPALPAAKIFGKPAILLTDWFVEPEHYSSQTLKYADQVLFLDEEGVFEEPPWVRGKVSYVGPVLRSFDYTREDRERARRELDLPLDAFVVSVFPGGFNTEQRAPAADLVLGAFHLLPGGAKRLIWIAGEDLELLREKAGGREDVILRDHDWQIDRTMVASDVAITKATRTTNLELVSLGVPSVALCSGLNRTDETRVRTMEGVVALDVPQSSAERLRDALVGLARRKPMRKSAGQNSSAGNIAGRICIHLGLKPEIRSAAD